MKVRSVCYALKLFIVVFLGNFSFGKDTDFFAFGAVIFISIYQMTPLPFSAAVKQPHLLQCALHYYDRAVMLPSVEIRSRIMTGVLL